MTRLSLPSFLSFAVALTAATPLAALCADPPPPGGGQPPAARPDRPDSPRPKVPDNLDRREIRVGDETREYFIHVPAAVRGRPAPVVFVLHGGGQRSGLAMHRNVDHTRLADREGFVVVYPSGANGWNVGGPDAYAVRRPNTSRADDLGFFRAMFDALVAGGVADRRRIYVTGGSGGGVMTYYLACHLGDRIAGIGAVAATLPKAAKAWPKPATPIPTVILLGTKDPLMPWEGSEHLLGAAETAAYWRQVNGCGGEGEKRELPDRDPKDGCRVSAESWAGKAPVALYRMEGHGHGWPMARAGGDRTGPKTRDISAPEEIWAFLKGHMRPPAVRGLPPPRQPGEAFIGPHQSGAKNNRSDAAGITNPPSDNRV